MLIFLNVSRGGGHEGAWRPFHAMYRAYRAEGAARWRSARQSGQGRPQGGALAPWGFIGSGEIVTYDLFAPVCLTCAKLCTSTSAQPRHVVYSRIIDVL